MARCQLCAIPSISVQTWLWRKFTWYSITPAGIHYIYLLTVSRTCCVTPTLDAMAPEKCVNNLELVIFKLIPEIDILSNSYENSLKWMPQDPTDNQSTSIRVMAWYLWRHMASLGHNELRQPDHTFLQCELKSDRIRYSDIIMSAMASHITGASIICSIVCSGADQRKHQWWL